MKNLIYTLVLVLIVTACGGGGEEPEPIPLHPGSSILTFPNQNSECTVGTNKTSTNSTVLFKWGASLNTDSYELILKNLVSDEITNYNSLTNELEIELLRGIAYSWHVISKFKSVSETGISEIWKFYNAGEGVVSYAPFPAEAVSPINGSSLATTSGKIIFDWNGSDVENDIESYDVYFGTTDTPPIIKSGQVDSMFEDISISSATTYYWYVVTKDEQGNSSQSSLFTFSVD